MAKISELPSTASLTGTELVPIVQSSTTKTTLLSSIRSWLFGSPIALGSTTPNTVAATTLSSTGAATIGGTLGVTGNTTLSGTLTFSDGSVQTKSAQGPCFSARRSTDQSIGNSSDSVILFDSKDFDLTTAYTTGTGRFNPQVSGYYQINLYATAGGNTKTTIVFSIRKNGIPYTYTVFDNLPAGINNPWRSCTTALVLMNGTTDYIDCIANITAASGNSVSANSTFSACLVRAA